MRRLFSVIFIKLLTILIVSLKTYRSYQFTCKTSPLKLSFETLLLARSRYKRCPKNADSNSGLVYRGMWLLFISHPKSLKLKNIRTPQMVLLFVKFLGQIYFLTDHLSGQADAENCQAGDPLWCNWAISTNTSGDPSEMHSVKIQE